MSDIKPLNGSNTLVTFNCFMDVEGAEGDAASSVTSAIRVAGAGELLTEQFIYSLIHSADGFALATTAAGAFPDLKACIPLKNGSQMLSVVRGGHYEHRATLEQGGRLVLGEVSRTLSRDSNFA